MPGLSLTILGAGPAGPNPGGANSGYLVREDDHAVVVDCGSGTAGRIAQHVAPHRLGGVVVSHLHPDHYIDVIALYYILKFGPPLAARVPLHVPPGGNHLLRELGALVASDAGMLDDIFEISDYSAGRETSIGGLCFTFHRVQHYVLSHAMRIHGGSAATLAFSSDVAPCRELVEAARGADLFLCESALLDCSQDDPDPSRRGHLCAREAGEAARAAEVKRLVITHYRSGPSEDAHHLAAARQAFDGPIELAREGATYTVG
jgi:ribonuclease BN (tRNA processing enzyme)